MYIDLQELLEGAPIDDDKLHVDDDLSDALDATENAEDNIAVQVEQLDSLATLSGVAMALESILDDIKTNGLPADGGKSIARVHSGVVGQLRHLGIESQFITASLENYDDVSQEQIVASLEGVVARIWDALSNATAKFAKGMEDFFKNFYQDIYNLSGQAQRLLHDLNGLDKPKREMLVGSQLHKLHLNGNTSTEAIIKGYENLVKTNKEIVPTYLAAVTHFYKVMFKSQQEIASLFNPLEAGATQSKVIEDFIKKVNVELDKVLKIGDDRTEVSGGMVFDSRNIVLRQLPEMKVKHPELKVPTSAEVRAMTIPEMKKILTLIAEDAPVIKSWWGRYNDLAEELRRARAEAATDSKKIDRNWLMKLLARQATHDQLSYWHLDLLRPINVLSWHTLSVTRSMLKLVDKNIKNYERKI